VDAIPDLSDTQVIIYSRWDRSPDLIEDQVTYPIVSALLGTPKVKTIRGFSDFGFSYVYVIFQDGTDIYWARSRVLEYLSKIQPLLPEGVRTEIGPDATGVGWVFQYALVDDSGTHSLADLRHAAGLEPPLPRPVGAGRGRGRVDRRLRPAVPGDCRSEPPQGVRLVHHGGDRGGQAQQQRGRRAPAGAGGQGVHGPRPRLRPVEGPTSSRSCSRPTSAAHRCCCATWRRWPSAPRCAAASADLDGAGESVGGIVVMRHAENAREVIARVKTRLKELESSLRRACGS